MNDIELKPIYKQIISNESPLVKLYEWRNDERVRPYLRTTLDNYMDNQIDWLESIIKRTDCFYYYVFNNKKLVGYCALEQIHWQNSTAEISLLINPNESRKGIGKKVVNQLLSIAFNRYNLNLIWGEVYAHNPAIKFWSSVGFEFESTLRNRKYHNNEYHNSRIFSMTRDEYFK